MTRSPSSKTRILVVDDSTTIRRLLVEVLRADPSLEVVGTASNGRVALDRVAQLKPDLVTLDVEMPGMGGLEVLKNLQKTNPNLPVIMFSYLTELGAKTTLQALFLGARDYVAKPTRTENVDATRLRIQREVLEKIKAFFPTKRGGRAILPAVKLAGTPGLPSERKRIDVLVIGVSTGGPNALSMVLPQLPKSFPIPILIVQHMPPLFTKILAEQLTALGPLPFKEAEEGDVLAPGRGWIAPGDFHMVLEKSGRETAIRLHQGPAENSCRPSVDPLLRSAAQLYGPGVLSVVMTGMGQDGLKGCWAVREALGQIFVQDKASSVVWGMPGAVAMAGLADRMVPLDELAVEINRATRYGRGPLFQNKGLFPEA